MKTQSPLAELMFNEKDRILRIKVHEGAEMDLEMAKVHYSAISKLVGDKKYRALVDASNYYSIRREAWEYILDAGVNANRVATAHFNALVAMSLLQNSLFQHCQPLSP